MRVRVFFTPTDHAPIIPIYVRDCLLSDKEPKICTKNTGSNHGDNPLFKPTRLQIATIFLHIQNTRNLSPSRLQCSQHIPKQRKSRTPFTARILQCHLPVSLLSDRCSTSSMPRLPSSSGMAPAKSFRKSNGECLKSAGYSLPFQLFMISFTYF